MDGQKVEIKMKKIIKFGYKLEPNPATNKTFVKWDISEIRNISSEFKKVVSVNLLGFILHFM